MTEVYSSAITIIMLGIVVRSRSGIGAKMAPSGCE